MALCINLTDENGNNPVRLKFADDVSTRDMIDILSRFDKDLISAITQRKYTNVDSLPTIMETNLNLLRDNQKGRVVLESFDSITNNFIQWIGETAVDDMNQSLESLTDESTIKVLERKIQDIEEIELDTVKSQQINESLDSTENIELTEDIKAKSEEEVQNLSKEEILAQEQAANNTGESVVKLSRALTNSADPVINEVVKDYLNKTEKESFTETDPVKQSKIKNLRNSIANRLRSFKVKRLTDSEVEENDLAKSKKGKIKGYVSHTDNTIYIMPDVVGTKEEKEVILHELTHTVLRLKQGRGDSTFLERAEYIKQLLSAHKLQIATTGNKDLIELASRIENTTGDDLISNIEELAVRALTNEGVADALNSIKVEQNNTVTDQTLWSKIINAIRAALGIQTQDDTLGEAILTPIVDYINSSEDIDSLMTNDISDIDFYNQLEETDFLKADQLWKQYDESITVNYTKNGKSESFKSFDKIYLERIDRHVPKDMLKLSKYDQRKLSEWDYAISDLEQGDLVLVPKMKRQVDGSWHYEYKDSKGNWKSHPVSEGVKEGLDYKTMYLPVLYPTTPYYNTIAVATPNSIEGGKISKVDKSLILSVRKRDIANAKKIDEVVNNQIHDKLIISELTNYRKSKQAFYTKRGEKYVRSWVDDQGNEDQAKYKKLLSDHNYVTLFSPDRHFQIKNFDEGDIVKISFKKWDDINKKWKARDEREINARVNFTVGGKIHVSYNPAGTNEVKHYIIDPEDVIELSKQKSNILDSNLDTIGKKLASDSNWEVRAVKGSSLMTEDQYNKFLKSKGKTPDKDGYKKYVENHELRREAGLQYVSNLKPGDAVLVPWEGKDSSGFKWRKVLFASSTGIFVEETTLEGVKYPKFYKTEQIKHVAISKKGALDILQKYEATEAIFDKAGENSFKERGNAYFHIPIYIPKFNGKNEEEVRIAREQSMRYVKMLKPGDTVTELVPLNGKVVSLVKTVISIDNGIIRTVYRSKNDPKQIIISNVTIDNISKIEYKSDRHPDYKNTTYDRPEIIDMFDRKSQKYAEKLFSKKVFKHNKPVNWERHGSFQINNINDAEALFITGKNGVEYLTYKDSGYPKYRIVGNASNFKVVALSPPLVDDNNKYIPDSQNEIEEVFSSKDDINKHIRVKKLKGGKFMLDSGKDRAFDIQYFYTNKGGARAPKPEIVSMMLSASPGEMLNYRYKKGNSYQYVEAQIIGSTIRNVIIGYENKKPVFAQQPVITVLQKFDDRYVTMDIKMNDVISIGKFRTFTKATPKKVVTAPINLASTEEEFDQFELVNDNESEQNSQTIDQTDEWEDEVPFYENFNASYEASESKDNEDIEEIKPVLPSKEEELIMQKPDKRARILKPGDPQPTSGLVLPIGISGSGKSTWINSLTNRTVISPDEIRKELTGDISNQSRNGEVFKIAKARAIEALSNGKLVVFDATNLNTKLRNDLITEIEKGVGNEIPISYKVLASDPELSKKRIKNDLLSGKDRSAVPDKVIDTQYQQYLQTLSDLGIEPPKPVKQIKIRYNPDPRHQGYKSIVTSFLGILGNKIGSVNINVVRNSTDQLYQVPNTSLVINERYPMKDVTVQQLVIPILDKAGLAMPDLSELSIFEEYTDNRDEQLALLSTIVQNLESYDQNVQDTIRPILNEYKEIYDQVMNYNWEGTVFDAVKDDPIFAGSVSDLEVDITLDEDRLKDLEIIKEVKCLK